MREARGAPCRSTLWRRMFERLITPASILAQAYRPVTLRPFRLAQLGDLHAVVLRSPLHRFLAPRQRLGDRPHRHPLAGEEVKLLDLVLPPRLPMPLELFFHRPPSR